MEFELADGVLTLKAGSKLCIPNKTNADGTKAFITHIVPADKIVNQSGTNTDAMICYRTDTQTCYTLPGFAHYSGTTAPTSPSNVMTWYDTTENDVKVYHGTSWISGCSLLLGIFDNKEGKVTALKRVFNGFGIIGLTAFSLPGVKCRFIIGRTTNGSYITKDVTTTSVLTRDYDAISSTMVSRNFCITPTGSFISSGPLDEQYDELGNRVNTYDTTTPIVPLMSYLLDTRIHDIKFYDVFATCNSDITNVSNAGRSILSSMSMPSNKYINLTLGASGNTYTAPANGWFNLMKMAASQAENIHMITSSTDIISWGTTTNVNVSLLLPVSAGDIVKITYTATGDVALFRFIYAKGDQ